MELEYKVREREEYKLRINDEFDEAGALLEKVIVRPDPLPPRPMCRLREISLKIIVVPCNGTFLFLSTLPLRCSQATAAFPSEYVRCREWCTKKKNSVCCCCNFCAVM